MKKIFTLLFISSVSFSTYAQFSDDFESYSSGDYLAESSSSWSTWSGSGEGTDEDVQVTNMLANNSSNSIYFESTSANGGPQDVVLPFNTVFSQGMFVFGADFYIPAQSTGAYYNFQASTTIGETWTLNCHITFDQVNTGIEFTNSDDSTLIEVIDGFAPNSWFNLRVEADLTSNNWEIFINEVSQGTFTNTNTEIASIDFYPVEGNMFYIDNVFVEMPNQIDVALTELTSPITAEIPASIDITGEVINLGNETITSMDITWTDGTDSYTDQLTGLNIPPLGTYEFSHADALNSTTTGTTTLTVTVSNVNGGIDEDSSNNEQMISIEFEEQSPTFNCEIEGCVDPGDGSGEYSTYAQCVFFCSNSIEEETLLQQQITPNPTTENSSLNITVDNKEVIISIANLAGQLISSEHYGKLNGEHKLNLNTSSLPNGIYLIDVIVEGTSSTHKLIKQ